MTAFVLTNAQGEAVSIGTVIPDTLPAGLTSTQISDADFTAIKEGLKRWQNGALVDTNKAAIQTNTTTIEQRLDTAINTMKNWVQANPTGATLNAAQTLALVKMLIGMAKLMRNQLDDTTGT